MSTPREVRKTRVVHLVYSFGVGGLERVIANLVNFSDPDQVEHIVITQIDDTSFAGQLKHPVQFYCIDKQDGLDLSSHYRFIRLLRDIRPDVLHTYNFGTLEYHAAAFLARVKIRVHADHGMQSSYKKITNPLKYELFRRAIAKFIRYYVVVSEDLYGWATQRIHLKPPKLRLIFNGIDTAEFAHPDRQRVFDERQADVGDSRTFICVGRLVDVKNHELLIRAFARAVDSNPVMQRCQLKIVGDGPLLDQLNALVTELGCESHIQLLGSRDDIPALLKSADVFVLSSRYEAQPMTILEAMASGLPVIATNVGGVATVVKDQVTGMLVDSEDVAQMAMALVTAASAPERMLQYGREGVKLVNKTFSVQAMCATYNRLYGVQVNPNGDGSENSLSP